MLVVRYLLKTFLYSSSARCSNDDDDDDENDDVWNITPCMGEAFPRKGYFLCTVVLIYEERCLPFSHPRVLSLIDSLSSNGINGRVEEAHR